METLIDRGFWHGTAWISSNFEPQKKHLDSPYRNFFQIDAPPLATPLRAAMKSKLSSVALGMLILSVHAPASVIVYENFTSPSKLGNTGANATLATDSYTFGTWVYSNGNGGIDAAATGDGTGSSSINLIATTSQARPQAGRGTNGRAVSVIFAGGLFTNGVEYTVSFDVIGDASGDDNGRYWLAEVFGYGNLASGNTIGIDGTQNGWGTGAGTPKPFTKAGTATVNFLADSASNGVLLTGENAAGTTSVSFNFTYDGTNSPDIAFAVGTYNNIFALDNFQIVPEPSSLALLAMGALGLASRRRR
jgi:PEP-CTERM motif